MMPDLSPYCNWQVGQLGKKHQNHVDLSFYGPPGAHLQQDNNQHYVEQRRVDITKPWIKLKETVSKWANTCL
jgi:hypothetical protein